MTFKGDEFINIKIATMNKRQKSDLPYVQIATVCFLTIVTQSIIEQYYSVKESINTLDSNVWIVLVADFAYFFLVYLAWWAVFVFFKETKRKKSIKQPLR